MTDAPIILIAEDEQPIVRFLRISLAKEGYRLRFAATAAEALLELQSRPPDLLLLDLGLPDMDGLFVLDRLRQWSRIPVVVLSARDQEWHKVEALDRGADDYLTKPFGVGELLARIRVALRHRAAEASGNNPVESVVRSGELEIDMERRQVTLRGEQVHLTPIEYRLLTTLAAHAGRVITHKALLKLVWGPGNDDSHQVRVHMANLRQKIEGDPAQPRHILTEQGVGYRFAEGSNAA